MITIDSEAWAAGFAAGEAGQPLTACPYPASSPEALSWHSGFIAGRWLHYYERVKPDRREANVKP
jgi:hypothetical protein